MLGCSGFPCGFDKQCFIETDGNFERDLLIPC
jgi:hypothetical protein